MSRYRFIHAEQVTYPITVLYRVLGVARSGYYGWRQRGPSVRQQADQQLSAQIAARSTGSSWRQPPKADNDRSGLESCSVKRPAPRSGPWCGNPMGR